MDIIPIIKNKIDKLIKEIEVEAEKSNDYEINLEYDAKKEVLEELNEFIGVVETLNDVTKEIKNLETKHTDLLKMKENLTKKVK
jgi:adenylyl- and sulfurtransferase ThiI